MPLEASSQYIKTYVPGSKIKIYDNAAHGLYYTAADEVMEDILNFVS